MSEQNAASMSNDQNAFSGMLEGILSNPEMMSLIGSIAKELKDAAPTAADKEPAPTKNDMAELSSDTALSSTGGNSDSAALVSRLAPLLSGNTSLGGKEDDRACLLRALKPYLSHGRSEAIDYIIRFASIAKLLRNLS